MSNDLFNNKMVGRVVDLKKMREPEVEPEIKPAPKAKGGLFWFRQNLPPGDSDDNRGRIRCARFCRNQGHRVDFLKHYKHLEKKENFIEKEIIKEYLADEEAEEKKRNTLALFFNFICSAVKLWWLPLFVIRFVWILFWRIFKILFFRKRSKRSPRHKVEVVAPKKDVRMERSPLVNLRKKIADKPPKKNLFFGLGEFLTVSGEMFKSFFVHKKKDNWRERLVLKALGKKKFQPFRHFFIFIFLSVLVVSPLAFLNFYNKFGLNDLRGRVLGATEQAMGDLQSAAAAVSNLDLKQASANFGAAEESFKQANDDLSAVSDILFQLGKVIPNDKIKLAAASKNIVSAGAAASSLGNNLSLAIGSFFSGKDETLSAMIDNFISYESAAAADAQKLNEEISQIDVNALPLEYREQFLSLKIKSSDLELILAKNIELVKKINIFLGRESDQRYLLVFENNAEMRASGGFVGSYALVDFSQGKIKNVEAPGGGSYDTRGGLTEFIVPPAPLTLVNPRWYFWDANWWPDWEKSAQKLSWFYEKSGGPSTDGVIAFTPTVLERILAAIGPIDMSSTHGVVMDADNLWENLRQIIEQEKAADQKLPYDLAENKPKKVIGELMQQIFAELPKRMDREKFIELLSGIETDLTEKQILFYFKNDELQAEAETRNWAGRVQETNKDYLLVVNTNIGGGKSDRAMQETIRHQTEVSPDGTIIDNLTITRVNGGVSLGQIPGELNVDWLRIYVPEGSELLSVSGFKTPDPIYFNTPAATWQTDPDVAAEEGDNARIDSKNQNTKIYREAGKTVFANWSMVDPGESAIISLRYRLPFKLEKNIAAAPDKSGFDELIDKIVKTEKKDLYVYSLLVQKQPGSLFSSINTELILPDNFKIDWKYPADLATEDHYWKNSENLNSDKFWAVVMEIN